jgi:hypothetical protein
MRAFGQFELSYVSRLRGTLSDKATLQASEITEV